MKKLVNKLYKMPVLPMDEFADLMGMIDSDFDLSDEENSEEEEIRVEQRDAGIVRMREFYERRIDILDYFDDEKIRKTFRFDRVSINYITGNRLNKVLADSRYMIFFSTRASCRSVTKANQLMQEKTLATSSSPCSPTILCNGHLSSSLWKCIENEPAFNLPIHSCCL